MISNKLQLTLRDRKVLAAICTLVILCSSISAFVAYDAGVKAQSSSALTMQTNSGGPYPGAPSYTFWKEGSTYYTKDPNGALLSSTNAATLILEVKALLDPLIGGKLYFMLEKYDIDTEIDFTGYRGVTLEMESKNWYNEVNVGFFATANIRSFFYVNNQASAGVYSFTVLNCKFTGNFPTWNTDGIVVKYSDRTVIDNCVFRYCRNGIEGGSGGDNWKCSFNSIQYGEQGLIFSGTNSAFDNFYIHNMTYLGVYNAAANTIYNHFQIYYMQGAISAFNFYYSLGSSLINSQIYFNNQGAAYGVNVWKSVGCKILNNEIYGNYFGVAIDASAGTNSTFNVISNNHVYDNTWGLVEGYGSGSSSGGTIDYNIFSSNTMNGPVYLGENNAPNTYDIFLLGTNSHATSMYNGTDWLP